MRKPIILRFGHHIAIKKELNTGQGNYQTIRLNNYATTNAGVPNQISFAVGVNLTF